MKTDAPQHAKTIQTGFSLLQKFQLGIIFALYLLVGVNSGGFGVILPNFTATYNLSKSDTGLLFLSLTGGYLIAALISSWLAERLGLRAFILTGLALFVVGSLTLGLLPPFALAWLARLILGVAVGIMETGGNFYVAALPRNTALLNYLHAFFGAGALLGPIIATWVLENKWGWNSLYLIWLVVVLLLSVGFNLAFGRLSLSPAQIKPTGQTTTTRSPTNPMLTALKLPLIWLSSIFLLVYVGVETTVGSWSFTFLTEGQHYAVALAGGLVSVYWLGLTLGRFALGALVGRLKLAESDKVVLMTCIIGSFVGAGLVWIAPGQALVSGLGLLLIGFFYGPIYPTTLAILSRMVAPSLVSSGIALITGLSILGVTLFPGLAGSLLEIWGLSLLYPYILILTALMLLLGLILLRPQKSMNDER